MDQLDDSELIACYRKGDVQALEILVQRYKRPLFSYILNMTGNSGDADEIFQDAWMKVIRKIGLYRHKNFFGWLVRITHNVIIDGTRRKKPNVSLDAETGDEGGSLGNILPDEGFAPDQNSQNKDLGRVISEAVALLPDEQKEVFLLRTKMELPFKEIAKIQGTSINTALARMQYALTKLREPLSGSYQDLA